MSDSKENPRLVKAVWTAFGQQLRSWTGEMTVDGPEEGALSQECA